MATYTPNLNLYKPDPSDPFGEFRAKFNDNMDALDNGGGGGGGHTIVDENGSDMPAESKLQFTGNVSVSDDNVNGATVVDILGGGGNVYGAFIDQNRILASGTYSNSNPLIYTATEDCYADVAFLSADGDKNVYGYIDGVQIDRLFNNSGIVVSNEIYPLRKGQTLRVETSRINSDSAYTIYGVTQGTNGIFAPVIYSDNERKIGIWRDNKPLYAKTVSFTTGNTSGYLNYLTDIENPETMMIDFGGSFYVTGTARVPAMAYFGTLDAPADTNAFAILCNNDSNHLRLDYRVGTSAYSKTAYVTVLYTKTTDSAGSGNWNTDGVPTVHYSTNEQVIGTWIDGKPIYKKTWDFSGSPVMLNYADWVNSGISAGENIKAIMSAELKYGAVILANVEVGVNVDGYPVGFQKLDNLNTRGVSYCTLIYTKTTD